MPCRLKVFPCAAARAQPLSAFGLPLRRRPPAAGAAPVPCAAAHRLPELLPCLAPPAGQISATALLPLAQLRRPATGRPATGRPAASPVLPGP
ncbi:hypothetical protein GUJ93_ZPchr0016g2546 [Zizania palustris]|uniref:Uncharacterized protein n=1 Tax=Zizania palustris TaxID=103762 RepID=A0A8J5T9E5_ZIZPA|nr:hypothetical protein GUJ93_ZPchr0016g2546 [Zizania palustris]